MEDTNLITEFGVGCCRVLMLDAVESWAGRLLSTGLGCRCVSVDDTNLVTEFGVGCCRVLRLDVFEYCIGMMLSIGLGCC